MKINWALDAAAIVLESGGSTAVAERTLENILKGLGQTGVTAVWRLDCIQLNVNENGRSSTFIRPVGLVGVNLARVSEAEALGERAASGEVSPDLMAAEIERVAKVRPPYGRWTMALAALVAGASFSQLAGGDLGALATCAVAAGVGQLFRSQLQLWGLQRASVTFLSALISALIGAVALRVGVSRAAPATFVGSIVYLVPGLLLINGFLDLTSERMLFVGTQRLLLATFLFLLLSIAVAIADALL